MGGDFHFGTLDEGTNIVVSEFSGEVAVRVGW